MTRCIHGSWQGTYCPACGGNRAVFGRQRHVPDLAAPVDGLREAAVAMIEHWDAFEEHHHYEDDGCRDRLRAALRNAGETT